VSCCSYRFGWLGIETSKPQEETDMRDKSKGVDGKKRRKKKPPELKEPKKR
jgi:hypothetical protein